MEVPEIRAQGPDAGKASYAGTVRPTRARRRSVVLPPGPEGGAQEGGGVCMTPGGGLTEEDQRGVRPASPLRDPSV